LSSATHLTLPPLAPGGSTRPTSKKADPPPPSTAGIRSPCAANSSRPTPGYRHRQGSEQLR
jgi:hypothetical protein